MSPKCDGGGDGGPLPPGQRTAGGGGPTGVKRGVAIACGASAILHLSVLLALDGVERPRSPPRPTPPSLTLLQPAAAPPVTAIDVAIIDLAPAAVEVSTAPTPADPGPPLPRPPPPAPGAAAVVARPGAPTESASGGAGEAGELAAAGAIDPGSGGGGGEAGPGRSTLAMRVGARPDLGVHHRQLHLIDDPDAPPPWTPPPPSGELAPSGGGTHQTQRPGFRGKVAADGKVSFEDEPAFTFRFALPGPVTAARRAARRVERWSRDPDAQVRGAERDPTSGLEYDDYTRPLEQQADKDDHGGTVTLFGGRADVTDWAMRQAGQDPYQADKLRWMDATRAERVEAGRVYRARELARATELMRRHLDRLWARTDLDLAAKRTALFELWDDGAEAGEAEVVEAATRTRALVVGFIRAHLPAGSAGAYTTAELDGLNRRRTSRARFAPYD